MRESHSASSSSLQIALSMELVAARQSKLGATLACGCRSEGAFVGLGTGTCTCPSRHSTRSFTSAIDRHRVMFRFRARAGMISADNSAKPTLISPTAEKMERMHLVSLTLTHPGGDFIGALSTSLLKTSHVLRVVAKGHPPCCAKNEPHRFQNISCINSD